jgi:hypothetical protein
MPDEVPAPEPVNNGADNEILNTASADEPAAAELRDNPVPSKAALLAEYTALKNEQTQRIVVRDTVLYISITANTAIAAIYQQQQTQDARILLAIPFVSTLLFWIYATNDSMITQIRRYIVTNIIPKWSASGGNNESGLFGWEYLRRRRTLSRFLSKLIRLLAVWSTFSGASIAALIATAPNSQDLPHDMPWLAAAAFTALPYIFGLWLLDL